MRTPDVSVVISTHNRAEFLADAIRSVFAQTHADLELVIVDDASTDTTQDVIASECSAAKQRCPVKVVRLETKSERSVARNRGTLAASGRYVAFLDDDDAFLPEHIQTAMEGIRRHGVGLWIARVTNVDSRLSTLGPADMPFEDQLGDDELAILGIGVLTSSCVASRDAVQRLGGFDEDPAILRGVSEDIDFVIKLTMNVGVKYSIRPTVLRRIHGGSYTSDILFTRHLRFFGGLASLVERNRLRFRYRLSNHLLAFLHLYIAKNYAGGMAASEAWHHLRIALSTWPAIVRHAAAWRVIARAALVANPHAYATLRALHRRLRA